MSTDTAPEMTIRDYGAPFDDTDADVILQSSDKVHFRVYRIILAKASPVFKDMFSVPQPKTIDGQAEEIVPIIPVSEDSGTLAHLLTLCYPVPDYLSMASLDETNSVQKAAEKYIIAVVGRHFLNDSLIWTTNPVKAYRIAWTFRLEKEARMAAKMCLGLAMKLEEMGDELEHMEGPALHRLLSYHRACKQALIPTFVPGTHQQKYSLWDQFKVENTNLCCRACECSAIIMEKEPGLVIPSWWRRYTDSVSIALLERPSHRTPTRPEVILRATNLLDTTYMVEGTYNEHQAMKTLRLNITEAKRCPTCEDHVLETLLAYIQWLSDEIEKCISQVRSSLSSVILLPNAKHSVRSHNWQVVLDLPAGWQ